MGRSSIAPNRNSVEGSFDERQVNLSNSMPPINFATTENSATNIKPAVPTVPKLNVNSSYQIANTPEELKPSTNVNKNANIVKASGAMSLDDSHKRIMSKQVEATLKIRRKNEHIGPIQNDLTPWECWASSKSEYLKNKEKLTRPMVL